MPSSSFEMVLENIAWFLGIKAKIIRATRNIMNDVAIIIYFFMGPGECAIKFGFWFLLFGRCYIPLVLMDKICG